MHLETTTLPPVLDDLPENPVCSWVTRIEIDNRLARAIQLQVTGQNQAALIECENVLRIDPRVSLAYCIRASAKYELGDRKGSIDDWNRSMN